MIRLLQQSVGFLIQTLPVACIFFLAFDKEKLRVGGRWLYMSICAVLISFSVVFSGLMAILSQAGYSQEKIQDCADAYFYAVLILCMILAFLNVKAHFCKRLLILFIIVYYAAIIYSFSTLLVFRFFHEALSGILPYNRWNLMLLFALTALSLPALCWFMSARVREMLAVIDVARTTRACFYVCVELLLYIVFLNLASGYWMDASFYMLVCYCISNIIMMYMFFAEIQMAWKSAVMEEKLRVFELKYESIDNSIRETQHFRHDLRHHLGIISTLNSQGKKEELSAYPEEERQAVVRPWLQDFTATYLKHHIKYGNDEIREQIQAVYDAGYEEWILWNASNNYHYGGLEQ